MDLDQLLDMSSDELIELFHARARRRCVGVDVLCGWEDVCMCRWVNVWGMCIELKTVECIEEGYIHRGPGFGGGWCWRDCSE